MPNQGNLLSKTLVIGIIICFMLMSSSTIVVTKERIDYSPYEIVIDGPTCGKPGITYYYNFTINKYNTEYLIFNIDWGDGSSTHWHGVIESGNTITASRCWDKKGRYLIEATAKDPFGWGLFAEGELEVIISMYRASDDYKEIITFIKSDGKINWLSRRGLFRGSVSIRRGMYNALGIEGYRYCNGGIEKFSESQLVQVDAPSFIGYSLPYHPIYEYYTKGWAFGNIEWYWSD